MLVFFRHSFIRYWLKYKRGRLFFVKALPSSRYRVIRALT
ncbi:hypothetical protein HMPREF9554_01831 [Treponema phagedenis F0421]|nr:hypothetical protein HMPREF9554_01831 [Treponema phagedenis F0421]